MVSGVVKQIAQVCSARQLVATSGRAQLQWHDSDSVGTPHAVRVVRFAVLRGTRVLCTVRARTAHQQSGRALPISRVGGTRGGTCIAQSGMPANTEPSCCSLSAAFCLTARPCASDRTVSAARLL